MSGNKIDVVVQIPGACFTEPPFPIDVPLGRFPAGDYEVDFYKRVGGALPDRLVAQRRFTVSPTSTATRLTNYTDLWWNAAESGWGLNIAHHDSQQILATWFYYGFDGLPRWYVIPGGQWTGSTFQGTIYRTRGPYFGSTFSPSAVSAVAVGSGTIAFDTENQDRATISFTADGVTIQKSITRQPF